MLRCAVYAHDQLEVVHLNMIIGQTICALIKVYCIVLTHKTVAPPRGTSCACYYNLLTQHPFV